MTQPETDLKAEAANALAQLLRDIQSAKDFAIEQAPDVIQQMVAYHATINWIGVGVGAFFLFIGLIASPLILYLKPFRYDTDDAPSVIAGIGGILFGTIIGTCVITSHLSTAIKATFYPKWFIVEHLTRLLS